MPPTPCEQKLLHQGLKRPELKDELYMQLLKQTRGNPNVASKLKAWELFNLTAATMPPSKACARVCVCVCIPVLGSRRGSGGGEGVVRKRTQTCNIGA